MQIRFSAQMTQQAQALQQLHKLTGDQAARACAKALNDTGFEIRKAMQAEMRAVFDNPTDYILRSPRVRLATAQRLSVTIEPAYMGGKGVDPQKVLNAQTWGGRRRDKRSEVALRRAGILPNGYQTAIASPPYPGSDDGKGNLRGPFLVQLLSYLQAFGEQGYRANMRQRGYQSVHRGSARQSGRRYFVTYGAMRGGARTTRKGEADARTAHLQPGIWAASGTGGVDVRPVLLFVRQGTYQPRLDMDKVARRADAEAYMARRIRFRLREAAGV